MAGWTMFYPGSVGDVSGVGEELSWVPWSEVLDGDCGDGVACWCWVVDC